MAKDDFTNKNIFELMEASIEKLKELSIKEFTEEINGKRVHIHPFTGCTNKSLVFTHTF